jgi:hypothetical protein
MSPTSYRTAPPRDEECIIKHTLWNVKEIRESILFSTSAIAFLSPSIKEYNQKFDEKKRSSAVWISLTTLILLIYTTDE